MIIKKIEIDGFGKFNNYQVELDNNIQIIYGKNEAGKSTLMEFIKIMFYSRRKGESTSSEDKILRNKFAPWNNTAMKGAIEFEIDGSSYRLQKEINKTSVLKDVTLLQNQSKGELVKLGKREEVGENILGIDLSSFERSIYIPDLGNYGFEGSKSAKDSILDKILNLSTTGESELSATEIVNRVSKAIKDLNSTRGKGGKIQNLESKICNINYEIEKLKNFEDERSKLLEQINKIEKLIVERNSLQSQLKYSENLQKISELKKIISIIENKNELIKEIEFQGINYSNLDNLVQNLNQIKDEIDSYESKKKELESLIFSKDKDFVFISDEELNNLVDDINKRNDLQNKLNQAEFYLNLDNSNEIIFDNNLNEIFQKYRDMNSELQKLTDYKNEIEVYENNLNSKKEFLDNELSEKFDNYNNRKRIYFNTQIIALISTIMTFISYFCVKSIFPYLCIPSIIMIITLFLLSSNYINTKNDINSLKLKINEYDKDSKKAEIEKINSEILFLKNNILEIQREFSELSKKYIGDLNQQLICLKENISKKLNDKNCALIHEYYEKHAQSKGILNNKSINDEISDKSKKLKSKFIIILKDYTQIEDYSSAMNFFNNLISKKYNIDNIQKEIVSILNILGLENSDLDYLKNKLEDLQFKIQLPNIDISEKSQDSIDKRLIELEELNLDSTYIELKSKISSPSLSLEELENDLNLNDKKLSNMKLYLKSLNVVNNLIGETLDEIRMKFNPKLNEESSKIFKKLSSEKYENICITKDYKIMVKSGMMYKECNNLSSGTIDQAYLSLRIAISKLISKKVRLPLILDDILVRYDYERMKSTLNFLKENSKNNQTIMFTCHEYIASYAKQNGIKVINL